MAARKNPFYDSALFWVALGGVLVVIGGILTGIGIAQVEGVTAPKPKPDLFSNGWFDVGLAAVGIGVLLALWALVLFLAHSHALQHEGVQSDDGLQPTPPVVVTSGHQFGNSGDSNQDISDPYEADLLGLIDRLEFPLRPCERQIVFRILRDAVQSLDNLPFLGIQPGNSAADVQPTGQRRKCSAKDDGEQMWHLPTTYKGLCDRGIIRSDQTRETLDDLHDQLMALRREVYDRYHPPTRSQIFVQPNEPKDAKEGDVWLKG